MEMLFILALCVSSASFTISTTSIFKEVREKISGYHHKLEELIHCPWCLSHWITFVILFSTWSWIGITGIGIVDFLMTTFAITCMSGIFHYVLLRAYEPVAKALVARQIEKMKNSQNNKG
jgi:hypothetical protein